MFPDPFEYSCFQRGPLGTVYIIWYGPGYFNTVAFLSQDIWFF